MKEIDTTPFDSILENAIKNFKNRKSFAKIKAETLAAFNEKSSVDIRKRSKENLSKLRRRLVTLSEREITLFRKLLDKDYILHHTTRHSLIEKMKATGDVRLLDPAELGRNNQQVLKKSDFYGIENNIFFGFGTLNSSIPAFTRNQTNPDTQEKEDYVTLRISYKDTDKHLFDTLWSSGHWAHYHSRTLLDLNFLNADVHIGQTTISTRFDHHNALNVDEYKLLKTVTYKYQDGTQQVVTYDMGEEIAIGDEFLPFFALSFIDRLRLLDTETRENVLQNLDDEWLIDNLMERFFRVDEFELHIPTELILKPDYVEYITPQERKKITSTVTELARAGNIAELEQLVQKGYPLFGYMFDDAYHYDNTPATASPLTVAIEQKNKTLLKWLISKNVAPGVFQKNQIFGSSDNSTLQSMLNILQAVVKTNDLEFIKFVIEECNLNINSYFESKTHDMKKQAEDLIKYANNPLVRMGQLFEKFRNPLGEFIYNNVDSDYAYLSLLSATKENQDLTVYDYVSSKLNYCKQENFSQRKPYDVLCFGGKNQYALLTAKELNALPIEKQIDLATQTKNTEIIEILGNSLSSEELLKKIRNELSNRDLNRDLIQKLVTLLRSKVGEQFKQDKDFLFSVCYKMSTDYAIEKDRAITIAKIIVEDFGFPPGEVIIASKHTKAHVLNFLCHYGCFDLAKEYIETGASFILPETDQISIFDKNKQLIEHSIMHGNTEFAQYLLAKGATPIIRDEKILWRMVYYSNAEGFDYALTLLKDHPCFDMQRINKETSLNPLVCALSQGKTDIALILKKHGAELPEDLAQHNFSDIFDNQNETVIKLIEDELLQKYDLSKRIKLADKTLEQLTDGSSLDDGDIPSLIWLLNSGVSAEMLGAWQDFAKKNTEGLSATEWLIQTLFDTSIRPMRVFEIVTKLSIDKAQISKVIDRMGHKILLTALEFHDSVACETFRTMQKYTTIAIDPKHNHHIVRSAAKNNARDFLRDFIVGIDDVKAIRSSDDDSKNNSLLFSAVQQGSMLTSPVMPEIIELLLQKGADPLEKVIDYNYSTNQNETKSIFNYVQNEKSELLSLFEKYTPINQRDEIHEHSYGTQVVEDSSQFLESDDESHSDDDHNDHEVNDELTHDEEQSIHEEHDAVSDPYQDDDEFDYDIESDDEALPLVEYPEQIKRTEFMDSTIQKISSRLKIYQHHNTGENWQRKKCNDEHWAKSQVLASKIYQLAGANVTPLKLFVSRKHNFHVASQFSPDSSTMEHALKNIDAMTPSQRRDVFNYFVVDAFIGNYDVVGNFNNIMLLDGKCIRVNFGSCFTHNARGDKHSFFKKEVTEIDFYLGKTSNASTRRPYQTLRQVFEKITSEELLAGMEKIINIDDRDLSECVLNYAPGNPSEQNELLEVILARKEDIRIKYNKLKQDVALFQASVSV